MIDDTRTTVQPHDHQRPASDDAAGATPWLLLIAGVPLLLLLFATLALIASPAGAMPSP